MVLLLDHRTVQTIVDGPGLMKRVIDVIEDSFRDVAAWPVPPDPTTFPSDLSQPKIFAISGAAPTQGVIGGVLHVRGGTAGMSMHGSYKLCFDLTSGDLLCLLEDGPIHKCMHGADIGVATKWLARDEARVLAVVTAGPASPGGDSSNDAAVAAGNKRATIVTMAALEAVCAVRPIEEIRIATTSAEHGAELVDTVQREIGVPATGGFSVEDAIRGASVVNLSTNNAFRGGGTSGVRREWIDPGAHVNAIIRGEIDAEFLCDCTIFPASIPHLLAIQPPWEPFASMVKNGTVVAPAGLDEVVAETKPGRRSRKEVTVFTGASIGAQHASLAAWVYRQAVEQGLGVEWQQER
jgi:ornithine cyclodeaminase/alanine dehydrogenase-like protein (mu-crystallin family)